jgi:hypothetical protein
MMKMLMSFEVSDLYEALSVGSFVSLDEATVGQLIEVMLDFGGADVLVVRKDLEFDPKRAVGESAGAISETPKTDKKQPCIPAPSSQFIINKKRWFDLANTCHHTSFRFFGVFPSFGFRNCGASGQVAQWTSKVPTSNGIRLPLGVLAQRISAPQLRHLDGLLRRADRIYSRRLRVLHASWASSFENSHTTVILTLFSANDDKTGPCWRPPNWLI